LEHGKGSLKVIGTDTDRSTAYDFLLMLHSSHGPISDRFRDKRWFQSKFTNFTTPVYLGPPLNGFPLEMRYHTGDEKTRMMGLRGPGRSLTISSAVRIHSTNVSDRRTDGRTPDDNIDRAYA